MNKAKDRGKGSITVQPGSTEAKRIEDTHGFNKAQKDRDARDKRAGNADQVKATGAAGDSK